MFSTELKVGLLMLIASAAVVGASILVTGWNPELAETYQVDVTFQDISGLQIGSPVRVAGIKIGSVENILLEGDKARVILKLFQKYQIFQDSKASVQSLGILGDKYIEIKRGDPTLPALENGDSIRITQASGSIEGVINQASDILNDVKGITSAMNQSFGGEEGKKRFDRILQNIEDLTQNVNEITASVNQRIENISDDLERFSGDLAEITSGTKNQIITTMQNFENASEGLDQMIAENRKNIVFLTQDLKEVANVLAEDVPKISQNFKEILTTNKDTISSSLTNLDRSFEKLDRTMENVESITGKIDRGEGTIGKLVNDETTVEGLNETIATLNKFLGGADKIKIDIGVHAEFLSSNQSSFSEKSQTKGYLTVKLQMLRDRYYALQLITNPRGQKTITKKTTTTRIDKKEGEDEVKEEETVKISQEMQISAFIAQRYYDTVLKIGLLENSFGLGAMQLFGREDQVAIGLDAWNFGGAYGTHLKGYVNWRFHSNLFMTFGVDDFASERPEFRSWFFGLGINFNEDIIKPYLSTIALSSM